MSIYRAGLKRKEVGRCNEKLRYKHFWAQKVGLMTFAISLNLTNISTKPHKSLPLDDNDEYLYLSPYEERFCNTYVRRNINSGSYRATRRDGKRAYTCEVMR